VGERKEKVKKKKGRKGIPNNRGLHVPEQAAEGEKRSREKREKKGKERMSLTHHVNGLSFHPMKGGKEPQKNPPTPSFFHCLYSERGKNLKGGEGD